jgi:hypothetical protein
VSRLLSVLALPAGILAGLTVVAGWRTAAILAGLAAAGCLAVLALACRVAGWRILDGCDRPPAGCCCCGCEDQPAGCPVWWPDAEHSYYPEPPVPVLETSPAGPDPLWDHFAEGHDLTRE